MLVKYTMKVLITGTSSGIGDGLSRYLSSSNHAVYGMSRRENMRLKRCKDYYHFLTDLLDAKKIKVSVGQIAKHEKKFDLLVLNAGVLGEFGDMHEIPTKTMKSVMDINLWANKDLLDAFYAAGVHFTQIVAISSGAAVNGNRGWNAYALSKAALNMMVQLYASEMPNTHVSALAPGLVDTSMQAYVTSLNSDARFPSLDRLRAASGTDQMPCPLELAPTLLRAMQRLKDHFPSGSFADLRTMDLD